MPRNEPIEAKFWRYVRPGAANECWEWTGGRYHNGYGQLRSALGTRAHRVSWILHNGPIAAGMFVCHHCDNPPCVNPAHLFLGSARDNMLDMVSKGRNPPPERHWRKTRPWLAAAATARYSGQNNSRAVFTDAQILEYRRRAAAGESVRGMALADGVNPMTLNSAVRGKSWKHLPGALPPIADRSRKKACQ